MSELSTEQLAHRLHELELVSDHQFREVWGHSANRALPPGEFVKLLIRKELLTNYQAERLVKGERAGFFYGKYKVLYLVGTGTFARVFRAVDRQTGAVVAVKVLRKRYAEDPTKTARFDHEGQVGLNLRHPNIVPIYEVNSVQNSHYLVMEFVEGRNLREFIRVRKILDPLEATRLIADVAAGLQYALNFGVYHRDLKMSNVLISTRGEVKLVDFGLAGAVESFADDSVPRTVDYAGLEKATRAPKDDPRSDIFFLGCMYYNLLTGEAPLTETKDRMQRMSNARFTDVVPIARVNPSLPQFVVSCVTQAMALDVNRRYPTPAAMQKDLTLIIDHLIAREGSGTPTVASPSGQATPQAGAAPHSKVHQPTWVFVESNVNLQNVMRGALKKHGLRVLVISDPKRALARFADPLADRPDGIIISTGDLGRSGLDAFNEFASRDSTAEVPALLLLGEDQESWKSEAKLATHRASLTMPVRFGQVRETLLRLIEPTAAGKEVAGAHDETG